MKFDSSSILEKLVSFDTRTGDPNNKPTSECPEYINEALEDCGFHTELLEAEGYWTAFGRHGHGGFKILYLAHFDVVPTADGWDGDPFKLRIKGDRAYGRGSCDDKGNITSMLMMAKQISSVDLPCTMMIAATGDEEIGGRNGAGHLRDFLKRQGLFPDYIVIADGIGQQIIHRRRNGLPTQFKVKQKAASVKGRKETIRFDTETFATDTRHSAYLRPGVDRHAMLAASRYMDMNLESVVADVRGPFLKRNVVPDWVEVDFIHPDDSGEELIYDSALTDLMKSLLPIAYTSFPTRPSDKGTVIWPNVLSRQDDLWTLLCDIRAMTNDAEAVHQSFEKSLEGRLDLFSMKVIPGPGFVDVDPDSRLIRAAKWALEKLGVFYQINEGFGASDSRYFAGQGAELFDFGPIGGNVHGTNEWVSLSSIEENAELYFMIAELLIRDSYPF
ncbi:MAG: M20/M25/M40 family metallo-hydrolase [Candidatus Thorarchaeota archaeon]|nr:MAG: M20/M25/M40 family metallo-hydrolase [Candidatus Thorarchaeota archaeon]